MNVLRRRGVVLGAIGGAVVSAIVTALVAKQAFSVPMQFRPDVEVATGVGQGSKLPGPPALTPEQMATIKRISSEIDQKKSEITKLEAELAKIQPAIKPKIVEYLWVDDLTLRTVGPFGAENNKDQFSRGSILIEKIIDDTSMIVTVRNGYRGQYGIGGVSPPKILVVDYDTNGLVDRGIIKESPVFEYIGTRIHNGARMHTVRKYAQE